MPKHVAGDERHVRPREDDDDDRHADEREQLTVHGPSRLEGHRIPQQGRARAS